MRPISRLYRNLANSRQALWAERRLSEALLTRWVGKNDRAALPARHILLSATGGGSVGDQAMFESFVANVVGDVVVVVRNNGSLLRIPHGEEARVTVLPLPGLLYGWTKPYLRDLRILAAEIAKSHTVSVVGADIMDGAYNARASARRFWVAAFAAKLGLNSQVLGFSWNAHPDARAVDAMLFASNQGVALLARDPKSASRLRDAGSKTVVDVADLAFLAPRSEALPDELAAWIAQQRADGRKVVVVNANYLLEHYVEQVPAYSALIAQQLENGFSFILLPHDSRNAPSDESLAEDIWAASGSSDRVFLISKILLPNDVVTLSSQVDFVITGRMHLAILAAIAGTPSVAVSYQGKIEGLYKRLGLDCFVLPDETFVAQLDDKFHSTDRDLEQIRVDLNAHLPLMMDLSRKNFERITTLPAPRA
jgi:colanic acid/amylovoran biosynthesis protein